jgi:putative SOS response-associated peptidase YedK
MCGRYSAAGTLDEFAKMIDFICRAPFFAPRYNIAPRQQAPVIVLENGEPTMKLMRWGLIPGWAKDESIGDKLINARAETIAEKTSFKRPFEFQRCLVVADGFCGVVGSRQPDGRSHYQIGERQFRLPSAASGFVRREENLRESHQDGVDGRSDGGEQLRQARQRCAGDIEHDGEWLVCIRSTRTFIDRDPDQDALNS